MTTLNRPAVSVCVITYNQESYIRECLASIVEQKTDFDFEVIVGEDCSTDGTRGIVQEFEHRYPGKVRGIYQEKNVGGGLKNHLDTHNASRGEFVAHVDGDDYLYPGKLQKQYDFLKANQEFTVVWHLVDSVSPEGGWLDGKRTYTGMYPDGVVTFEKGLQFGSPGAHSSVMYRRDARRTRHPDFNVLDMFYSWEYLSSGLGKILPETLGAYRVMTGGQTQKRATQIKWLNHHHVSYFYRLYPQQKASVFLFSLGNMAQDLLNLRKTWWPFAKLAGQSICMKGILGIPLHIYELKKRKKPPLEMHPN